MNGFSGQIVNKRAEEGSVCRLARHEPGEGVCVREPLIRGVRSSRRRRLTCDIWGLKLISFRSTDPGDRLCNIWHRSTPSRRACAKSKTTAEGHTTRWFGGRTLQSINHRPHCLHSSMSARERLPARSKPIGSSELVRGGQAEALRSVPCPRPGVAFTVSSVNPALSQLCVNCSTPPHYMPIPDACQLCCRHGM